MKPAREHYKEALKKEWSTYVVLFVVFGIFLLWRDEPLPPVWSASPLETVLAGINMACLLYYFVRRDGSLETAILVGSVMPLTLAAIMAMGSEPHWFGVVLVIVCGPALAYLSWRGYIRQRRGGQS